MQLTIDKPSNQTLQKLAIGLGIYLAGRLTLKFWSRYKRNQKRKSFPKDVIVLHQFPRSEFKPSLSSPCLKLETWLRMSGLKYQNEMSYFGRSSQGQVPFITLNEQDFHDSQFIIEHLSKIYNKQFTLQLSKSDQAIARGLFKLIEESFKWTLYYHRILIGKASDMGFSPILLNLIFKPKIRKALQIQGYGKHTTDEVYHIGKQDLQALEDFLGDKKFLFGEAMCNEDAVLFAYITQIVYFDQGPFKQFLNQSCPSLLRHFKTIKDQYWPEWTNPQ